VKGRLRCGGEETGEGRWKRKESPTAAEEGQSQGAGKLGSLLGEKRNPKSKEESTNKEGRESHGHKSIEKKMTYYNESFLRHSGRGGEKRWESTTVADHLGGGGLAREEPNLCRVLDYLRMVGRHIEIKKEEEGNGRQRKDLGISPYVGKKRG